MRLLSRNGNIDDKSIRDYVEPPHEESDEDFVNRLVDSESEDEDDESSDFGNNGYVDTTSDSEEETCDEQFRPQGSDLV